MGSCQVPLEALIEEVMKDLNAGRCNTRLSRSALSANCCDDRGPAPGSRSRSQGWAARAAGMLAVSIILMGAGALAIRTWDGMHPENQSFSILIDSCSSTDPHVRQIARSQLWVRIRSIAATAASSKMSDQAVAEQNNDIINTVLRLIGHLREPRESDVNRIIQKLREGPKSK